MKDGAGPESVLDAQLLFGVHAHVNPVLVLVCEEGALCNPVNECPAACTERGDCSIAIVERCRKRNTQHEMDEWDQAPHGYSPGILRVSLELAEQPLGLT